MLDLSFETLAVIRVFGVPELVFGVLEFILGNNGICIREPVFGGVFEGVDVEIAA